MNSTRTAPDATPTGTVTFLFSDIEGSTRRWDADRAAMSEAVARHDELARAAISAHHGHVFKTLGDGFCCVFTVPSEAVAAALELQRLLLAQDFSAVDGLRVRIALHTGTADERDGDYFGPAVNRVARLLSTAHGEQVIVSGVTYDAARNGITPWASFKALGVHRLKDLSLPEHVFQLLASDLRSDFPPLRSLTALPNNLPPQLTSFVGREQEVTGIAELVGRKRLVTLVGSGGVGKTRTSLQVAASLLDGSGDGAWFIELAPLESGAYIPATVAHVLGVSLPPGGDPIENLVRALAAKQVLLIFDNCEHVIEAAARVVAALLRGCPKIKVLASSRQGLGITGEETYRLPSLDVPDPFRADRLSAHDAIRWSAIALFADRASAVDKRFALTHENLPIVADICRRLDGIPLALELAAARVKVLSPSQLRERIDERFRVLTGGSRDVLPRQQTLRALIDWSYDLLEARERAFFRRLGIFVNGFALEGALAVGHGDDADESAAFDLLASLVDKSLVLAETEGVVSRYRLLESTRAYAREKLEVSGEYELCATRHLIYLRDRFAEANERYQHTVRTADVDVLLFELDDVRAALDASLCGSNLVLGGQLLVEFSRAWGVLGLYEEGLVRSTTVLSRLPQQESGLLARLSTTAAYLAGQSGKLDRALVVAERAVTHARASADGPTLAMALLRYAHISVRLQNFGYAETAVREAEEIPMSAATRLQLLSVKAHLSAESGDYEAAARVYERVRQEYRSLGNAPLEMLTWMNLAEAEHRCGNTGRAIELSRELLPVARAQADRFLLIQSQALTNLAGYFAAVDDAQGASESARAAIANFAEHEPQAAVVVAAIEHLALGLALARDFSRASILAGYGDAALLSHGFVREYTEKTTHDRLTALLDAHLGASEFERLLAEGAALTPEAAVARALDIS